MVVFLVDRRYAEKVYARNLEETTKMGWRRNVGR